jgi:RND family efflux transporter MFP subunit
LKAQRAEAEASLADAKANAERARQLEQSGAMSAQQIAQFYTAEKTAQARLDSAKARIRAEELRLSHTKVLASDAGVISARSATLGAVVQPGQELFRLIRQGRLEWRGEITSSELSQVRVGQSALIDAPDLTQVRGKVRMVAPTVDAQTRNALVYVDLPPSAVLKAGMSVKGVFELGRASAQTVPQSALLRRDGFAYLYVMEGADRVKLTKVELGRRAGERIEIAKGLAPNARFVVSGVGFLNDGDLVKVLAEGKGPSDVK